MLRYLTAGESHGRALVVIVEGVPSNLIINADFVDRDLRRRQGGYGRGGRMRIESDCIQFYSGVRHGKTVGSPLAMLIENRDWKNWQEIMSPAEADISEMAVPDLPAERNESAESGLFQESVRFKPVTRPRPGHADMSGALKYNQKDIRNILERSSARETAARVAAGGIAKAILKQFGIEVYSWVTEIGGVRAEKQLMPGSVYYSSIKERPAVPREIYAIAEESEVRCPDKQLSEDIKIRIDEAKKNGDSLGGIFEVVITGVPVGLGSHVQSDRKLDGQLAGAMVSIQAIKGVEIGVGFEEGRKPGSEVHDEICYVQNSFRRKTNYAGGIEGGMSNGEDIVIRAVMKPIPTLYKPLMSVDMCTKEPFEASVERSDICAVPAAAVIGEAVAAFEIAKAFLEKFGGDSMEEVKRNYDSYMEYLRDF